MDFKLSSSWVNEKEDKRDMIFVGSVTCEILTVRDLVDFLETIL